MLNNTDKLSHLREDWIDNLPLVNFIDINLDDPKPLGLLEDICS